MEATERGDNEKRELRARLEAAVEKAKAACESLEEKTVAAAKATDKAVREHPYQAVGIAFGVGVLIGVLVARCRRGGD
ncbi:MAG: YqjD family protein [Limisphaerales bacterium]